MAAILLLCTCQEAHSEKYAMNADQIQQARDFLNRFLDAMKRWDAVYYERLREDLEGNEETALQDLKSIYSTYLTQKERKLGREAGLSASKPSEYDEAIERIEEMDKNKIFIYTNQASGFMFNRRYRLKWTRDRWVIEKKEYYNDYDKKWINESF